MKPLYVWTGPMGSAKTTGALHAARRFERLGFKVALVRPKVSVRAHEQHGLLVTKNGEKFPALEGEDAHDVVLLADGADVVWIDEPFLFKNERALFDYICFLRKKSVILISAIGCDAEQKPFGQTMPKLLSVADRIYWCLADCDCCGAMDAGTRHVILRPYKSGEACPGGEESYCAACPDCWTRLQSIPPENRSSHLRRVMRPAKG